MNTRTITLLITILIFLLPNSQFAQDNANNSQAFWVHEDPVYPSRVADYEEYCTILAENCKKYNITEADWTTVSTDDLRYFHLSPIVNMGDLDKSRFSLLIDKMGENEFNELFDNFDNCYDTHNDYIVHLDNELSYMPIEMKEEESKMEYRKLTYWYVTPQNFQKVLDLAREFKKIYEQNNSKEYYRLYRSGFGTVGQFILVAVSAKNAEDFERRRKENHSLIGELTAPLYTELYNSIIKVESLNGFIRNNLSYHPDNID